MDMKAVIFIKYGRNTITWADIMHLKHEVQDLWSVKIHTRCKISKFCRNFRATKTYMGKFLGVAIFI